MSPLDGSNINIKSITDVYVELCKCYDECIEKRVENVGETLYVEHFFFCNTYELLDKEAQMTIAKYNFCKTFRCPPHSSLDDTPAQLVQDFMKIESEFNKRKGNNGNK